MLIRSSLEIAKPGMLLRGGDVVFAMVKFEAAADKRMVFLEENTIVFVLQGYKHLHFDNHSLEVKPGGVLFLKRGLYAMSELVEDGLSYEALVLFSTNKFLKAFSMKYFDGQPVRQDRVVEPYLFLPVDHLLAGFREQYMNYFKQSFANREALLQLKLEELFLLLISGSHGAAVREWIQGVVHKQLLDIEYVVRQYLFQPLTLNELAELSGRSLASFKRDFHDRFHGSPRKWILQQRLSHAQMLLSNTDQNIVEVALASGFESAPYFTRAFRQAFGEAPNVWRAKCATV